MRPRIPIRGDCPAASPSVGRSFPFFKHGKKNKKLNNSVKNERGCIAWLSIHSRKLAPMKSCVSSSTYPKLSAKNVFNSRFSERISVKIVRMRKISKTSLLRLCGSCPFGNDGPVFIYDTRE